MNFNHIKVNGKVFNCTGRSVVINNDSIIVDGKVVTGGDPVNSITVIIEGDVSVLECAGSVLSGKNLITNARILANSLSESKKNVWLGRVPRAKPDDFFTRYEAV